MRKETKTDIYATWRPERTAHRLTARLEADPNLWIETNDIVTAISALAREPIPPNLLDYIRRRLDGTVRKRQGRGRAATRRQEQGRNLAICVFFYRYEAWLTARARRHGLKGWAALAGADWWQGPPSERAARMVQRRIQQHNLSWRTIRNIAKDKPYAVIR